MNVVIRKIGNSEGVILPREILEHLNVRAGDVLAMTEQEGALHLRPLADDPAEFERKMTVARERMKKYETAYRVLAK